MQVSVFREPAFEKNALHEYLDNEDAEGNIANTDSIAASTGGGYGFGKGYAESVSASGSGEGGGGFGGGKGWGGSRSGDRDGDGVSEKNRQGGDEDGEMEMEVGMRRVVANLKRHVSRRYRWFFCCFLVIAMRVACCGCCCFRCCLLFLIQPRSVPEYLYLRRSGQPSWVLDQAFHLGCIAIPLCGGHFDLAVWPVCPSG